MDKKGFISLEYLFSIFIVLIIASGLLFFSQSTIESSNNIEDTMQHRLILDKTANLINQVNAHGEGYCAYFHLDSKPGYYVITVEKDKLTIEFSNKKGETLILPISTDEKYKLYSGRSYLVSKSANGKIVIT
ncbi:hypothetical protein [Methanobrevibacter sp.]|uniref:hypothetical protein n=1 Tax=Methanobrevibacter sp. TaxID=66852 RepID=UPI00386F7093